MAKWLVATSWGPIGGRVDIGHVPEAWKGSGGLAVTSRASYANLLGPQADEQNRIMANPEAMVQ